jgi:hypothetical protein
MFFDISTKTGLSQNLQNFRNQVNHLQHKFSAMKKKVILTASTLVLVIVVAFMTKANARFVNVMYTDNFNPAQCQYPGALPAGCTSTNTGTICTTTAGALVYTYYQGGGCTVPFYKAF